MGYKLIKHLESAVYNRKLFYIDNDETDLPPITDKTSIMPGSEARALLSGDKWILNTGYEWIKVLSGALMTDVPNDPAGVYYVRESTANGGIWTVADLTSDIAVYDFEGGKSYLKWQLVMYEGGLYRAKDNFTAGTTFDPNDWEAIEAQIVTKLYNFT